MADRIKEYVINYDITANVANALAPLNDFKAAIDSLYNNEQRMSKMTGVSRLDAEFESLIGRIATAKTEFNRIQPSFNLEPLQNSLRTMERMVSESAINMQRTLQAALNGSNIGQNLNSKSLLSQNKRLLDNYQTEMGRVEAIVKEKRKQRNAMLPPDGKNKGSNQDAILSIYGDPRETEEFKILDNELKTHTEYLETLQKRAAKARGAYNTLAKQSGMPFLPNELMSPRQWRNLKKTGTKLGITQQQKLIEEYTTEVKRAAEAVKTARVKLYEEFEKFDVDGVLDREGILKDPTVLKLSDKLSKAEKDYKKWTSKLSKIEDDKATKEAIARQQKIRDDYAKQLRAARQAMPISGVTEPSENIPKELLDKVGRLPELKRAYEQAKQVALDKKRELSNAIKPPLPYSKPDFLSKGISTLFGDYKVAMQDYLANDNLESLQRAEAKKQEILKATGFNDRQFNHAFSQYKSYEQYENELTKWIEKQKRLEETFKNSKSYNDRRTTLLRLREAYAAQRQVETLRSKVAAESTAISASGGISEAMPSVLGIPKQVIEQAFTGKLTLVPDIASAKTKIASEKFSANLSLVPLLEELCAKLNSQTFKVNVIPQITDSKNKGNNVTTGAIGDLREEINALKRSAKTPITVGTNLDRGGLLGRAQSGYQTLQELANRHPITLTSRLNGGDAGFSYSLIRSRIAELSNANPIILTTRLNSGDAGFSYSLLKNRIAALSTANPIILSARINPGDVGFSLNGINKRIAALSSKNPINFAGTTTISTKGLEAAKNAQVSVSDVSKQVASLRELQQVWRSLPRTGSRTYTVNLKTTGLENIGNLERLIALVEKMPPSLRRSYNVAQNSGQNNIGSRRNPVYTRKAEDFYGRVRKLSYPFTGNTSFGARTPAALDMMKGMGVMMGVGGAMGVIGGSFSDAVGYQNTMETAKAILRDNYRGGNFNQDYNDMVRVVRDVAMRTKFTAPEAADAARFMAMAGLDIPMIKSAIAPIADVAAISDTDLGLVADKMTNIMTEFKVAPAKMRNLADMMTKTSTSTNTDMMMLAESLQYAGPMAFASGQSLAETLAMIGIMGNSGIQASMAGTTMRMMLQNLYNPNKNQAKFMQSIGLQTRDANGNRRSLYQILSDISRLTGSNDSKNVIGNLLAGKDAKNNIDTFDAASKLFRVTAAAGGASLLGNIDKVGDLIAKIQSASGNSEAVSIAKQNTVAGMWAQTKSAFTEAVVKVFEDTDMQKFLKDTLGGLIDYLKQPEFVQSVKDIFDLIKSIGKVLSTFVGWWIKLYQTFPNLVKWVMVGQMFFTQIGYLLNPFTQLIGLLSTFNKTITGTAAALGIVNGGTIVNSANGIIGGSFAAAAAMKARMMSRNPSSMATVLTNGQVSARFANQYAQAAQVYEKRFNVLDAALTASILTNGRKAPQTTRLAKLTQEAYQRRQLYTNAVERSEEIRRGYNRIYGTGHRALRAFTAGFNGVTGAYMMSSLFSSIKNALSGLFINFSGIIGTLLSPVTLAAGALGGLAIAAGVAAYNFYKQNEAWQQGIKNSGVQFREELQKAWGSDTSLKDVFEHIKTINVNSASINVNEGEIAKAVSKIAEDENLKSIYEVLNSKIREDIDGTLGIADTKLSGVSKGTFKEAYNQYISPMRSVMGNLPSFEQFLSYIEKGDVMSSIDETKAAAAITQAIIGQKGTQSGRYAQAEQKVLELTKDFNTLSVSEQIAQWDAYRQQILGIAEGFNPKNHPNLVPVTSGNFQQALSGSPAQYYEYWLGSYNSIMRFIDESPALKAIQAIHTLNSGVEERTEEWWDAIIDIIGATSFNDEHYNGIRDFTIPTRNGQIDYSRLTQKISATGERLNNNIGTYMQWVSQIYDIIFSNEGIAQQLSGVNFPTKEEIIRRLFGSESLPKWVRDSFTTPTSPSPGPDWEWNPIMGFWMKKSGATSTTTTPLPTGSTTSTTQPTVPKPTAYTPKNLNSGYESSYAQSAARPTQVVINIDKLMNTDKMMIASDAEERQLAGMMEDKIEQALDILKGQIVMSLQRGNYELS